MRWLRRSAIIAALVGLGILGRGWLTGAPSAQDRFWAPTLATSGAVLISLGQPVAYNLLSPQAQDRIQATAVDSDSHAAAPRTGTIPINQLIILRDRCVAIGDAVCLARMAALLEKHGKPYPIRGEGSTSSSDLRENATILVGAFDNQWTLRADGQLRFTFFKDSAPGKPTWFATACIVSGRSGNSPAHGPLGEDIERLCHRLEAPGREHGPPRRDCSWDYALRNHGSW